MLLEQQGPLVRSQYDPPSEATTRSFDDAHFMIGIMSISARSIGIMNSVMNTMALMMIVMANYSRSPCRMGRWFSYWPVAVFSTVAARSSASAR